MNRWLGLLALLIIGVTTVSLRKTAERGALPPPAEQGSSALTVPTEPESAAMPAAPDAAAAPAREQAVSHLSNDFLPASLRAELNRLPARARERALSRLERLHVPREDLADLHVTAGGQVYYACRLSAVNPAAAAVATVSAGAARASATADGDPVAIAAPPVRHSRPGSVNVLYLDFNGHAISGTAWNSTEQPVLQALPYDTDGDPTTFSATEQAAIIEIWERVSEDYAPFEVDVTTEEPATFTSTTGRAVITSARDASGITMPSGEAGGVAFIDVFGDPAYVAEWSPALIYYDNVTGAGGVAEAVSHELGHNLGLSHDGTTNSAYYHGHGTGDTSWAPIMGTGYDHNVSQWSKGEYYQANNPQDDLAIIAAHTGYRTDLAGATTAAASPMTTSGNLVSASGVLSPSTGAAVYSFNTAAGPIALAAATYRAPGGTHGGDADLKLELLDATGATVAVADPADSTDASLTYDAATAGIYYVRLTAAGTGDPFSSTPTGYTNYASYGRFALTGTIVAAAPVITSATTASCAGAQLFAYTITATNSPRSFTASPLPAGLTLNADTGVISGRPQAAGTFTIALGATNSLGTGTATLTLTVSAAAPAIVSLPSGRKVVSPGGAISFPVTAASSNGTPSYQWLCNGRAIAGATGATLALTNLKTTAGGYYQVAVTNSVGSITSAAIFLTVAPPKTQVVVWGDNSRGQALVPVGVTDAVASAAGYSHALALRRDGTVVGWGGNTVGQTTTPAGLNEIVAIAAGNFHSLALRSDGAVFAWGDPAVNQSKVPAGLGSVVAIATGYAHCLALKADGTVVAWGDNSGGQATVPAGLKSIVAIAAGNTHSLALKADGTVVAWGSNTSQQCAVPSGLKAVAIAAGFDFSLAQKSDGTVVGWGGNSFKQLTLPSGVTTLAAIAAGGYHGVGLKSDGTVTGWGYNGNGQTSVPAALKKVFAVGAGYFDSTAVRDATGDTAPAITVQPAAKTVLEQAKVTFSVTAGGGASVLQYQWRYNGAPLAGANAASLELPAATLTQAGSYDVVVSNELGSVTSQTAKLVVNKLPVITSLPPARQTFAEGRTLSFTAAATGTGTLKYQWYRNGKPVSGATKAAYVRAAATAADAGYYWVEITDSVGTRRSAAVFALFAPPATAIKGWGANTSGRLTLPAGLTDAVAIATGKTHALALKSGGTVVGWGDNTYKQRTVPTGLTGVVAIAAGEQHSVALKSDGTVVAWGDNTYGQTSIPSGLSGVVAIQARWFRSYALKSDGTVVGWGSGADTSTAAKALSGIVALSAGEYHALAINSAGKVFAWGDATAGDTTVPSGLTGVTAVAGGGYHSLAVKSDGTVTGWGDDGWGQRTMPSGLKGVTALAAGLTHSVALKSDGTVAAWGDKRAGQTTVPTGLARVLAVAACDTYTLALQSTYTGPSITDLADQKILSGTATGALAFTIGDPDTAMAKLTVKGASSNTTLVPAAGIVFGGSGANRTVKITPAAGKTGTAKITVTVSDGAKTANDVFTVTVVANTAPTITAIANQTVSPGVATAALAFTIGDSFTPAASLVLTKVSSDTKLVPVDKIVFGGSGANRTVKVTPVAGKSGAAKITITVSDGSLTASSAFTLTVNAAPTITALGGTTIAQNGSTDLLKFTIGDLETSASKLQITKTSSNLTLVPLAAIVLGGSGANRTVKITPVAGKTGTAKITITVSDGVRSASMAFTLTVTAKITAAAQADAAADRQAGAEPAARAALAGTAVVLAPVATDAAATFCWFKDGLPLAGAAGPALALAQLTLADAGFYRLEATESTGVVRSAAVRLTVVAAGSTYRKIDDTTREIRQTVAAAGETRGLALSVLLPGGWFFMSEAGVEPDTHPAAGDANLLEWAWPQAPAEPQTFVYTLRGPAGATETALDGLIQIAQPGGTTELPLEIPLR
jgi:alpha-tubulin suppressor-like RCC1 family protein